jgi:hypothetical protein
MLKLIAAACAVASLGACATITRGTTQAFEVKTTPSGAAVETSNGLYCKATPCVFPNVARNSNFTVTITKPGYKTVTSNVTNTTAGGGGAAMAGNIIFGGIIGAGVDATNGSMQDLVPNPLEVTLEVEGAPSPAAPASGQPVPGTTPVG